jgi:hypothetical protein
MRKSKPVIRFHTLCLYRVRTLRLVIGVKYQSIRYSCGAQSHNQQTIRITPEQKSLVNRAHLFPSSASLSNQMTKRRKQPDQRNELDRSPAQNGTAPHKNRTNRQTHPKTPGPVSRILKRIICKKGYRHETLIFWKAGYQQRQRNSTRGQSQYPKQPAQTSREIIH